MAEVHTAPTPNCLKQVLTQILSQTMTYYVSWSSYYPHSEALKLWTVLQEQRLLGIDNVGDAPVSTMCKCTLLCTSGAPDPQTQGPVPFMPPSRKWLPHLAPHWHPAIQLFGEGKPLTWAHRLVCFAFPLAHDLPFMLSIK